MFGVALKILYLRHEDSPAALFYDLLFSVVLFTFVKQME